MVGCSGGCFVVCFLVLCYRGAGERTVSNNELCIVSCDICKIITAFEFEVRGHQ